MRWIELFHDGSRPDRRHHAEKILLLVTQGTEDHWGEFEPLRGTSWEAGVEVVSAEALSHALHKYPLPLLRELGREPSASAKRVTREEGECKMKDVCLTWNPSTCKPGPKVPDCYDPPLSEGTHIEIVNLFRTVAQAWKEGRHTVVAVGEGFNIR